MPELSLPELEAGRDRLCALLATLGASGSSPSPATAPPGSAIPTSG
jgi:hypothetical protein